MYKYFSILVLSIVLFSCETENKVKPPNIILVMTDDQGYGDLSVHGSPDVSTPNIDNLKSQAVSLEDFQVSSTCAPTRAAIMTGRHPFKAGVTHTIFERERMALGITTLPEVLKRANYTSAIFGKWHLGDEPDYQPNKRGFDEIFIHGAGGIGQAFPGSCADVPGNNYFNPIIKHNDTFVQTKGFCTDVFFAQALSWIKEKSEQDRPFFAYIACNAPHEPFIAPESYKKKFKEQGYPENCQGFYGMVENIDDNMGILMEKLDAWELSDNTILIFMTDNGKTGNAGTGGIHGNYNAGMRGFKVSSHEGGTRVPFFIRWPGKFKAGREVDVLLNHYDILPTFAEIANIDISDILDLDGRSFLPLLKNEHYKPDDRYRFIHRGRWGLNPELADTSWVERALKWVGTEESCQPEFFKFKKYAVRNERYRLVDDTQLYDVINDPGETKNIVSEHPEVVEQMKKAYTKWWDNVRSYMVNENAPLSDEKPYWKAYYQQKESKGIPENRISNTVSVE